MHRYDNIYCHGIYSYGLYKYELYSYDQYKSWPVNKSSGSGYTYTTTYIVMACIVMAYVVMAHIVMAYNTDFTDVGHITNSENFNTDKPI